MLPDPLQRVQIPPSGIEKVRLAKDVVAGATLLDRLPVYADPTAPVAIKDWYFPTIIAYP